VAPPQPAHKGKPSAEYRTRSIFDRYSIVDDEDIREALVKVQALVETLPTERTVVPLRTAVGD